MLIGSIPPTGLPLPFISAGSTSLLVFMSAIGVVLNVDRHSWGPHKTNVLKGKGKTEQ
jgi:cell division protein FtsW